MAKIRVFELAKEFGLSSKEMEAQVRSMGFNIKNYMSTLEDYEAAEVRKTMRERQEDRLHAPKEGEQGQKVVKRKHPVVKLKKKVVLKKRPKVEEEKKEKEKPQEPPKEPETKVSQKEEPEQEAKSIPEVKGPEKKEPELKKEVRVEKKATSPAATPEKQVVKEEAKVKKETPKPKEEGKEAKSFVKVIARKSLDELKGVRPTRPQEKESKRPQAVPREHPKPQRPEVVPTTIETGEAGGAPKEAQRKPKKKGKRVVKISELEGLVRERRAKKQKAKEKLKPINKLLSEELMEPLEEMEPEKAPEEAASAPKGKQPKTKEKEEKKAPSTAPPKASKRRFAIYETIQVDELAKRMGVKVSDVIMKLMSLGVMATANQSIDFDVAAIVASEYGFEVEKKAVAEDLIHMEEEEDDEASLEPRPPVVTVMGHVDHGKTTLLDAIRHSDVASREAGGITQHIGAYHVTLPSGNKVVFLDTPGHEAFTQMRARGAQVTDIVVLVVAADDGVMAQTKEAIDHARAANVPIIVAVNKIDKPEANPDRVKTELSELGLVPEEWGGDTIFVEISAKKKIGIDEFLELLALQAEVLELKANAKKRAKGYVIEARLDKGRGPVATMIVREGTLKRGDAMVCGLHYGKVRAMLNDRGERVESAGPSMPVEVQGLSGVPEPGSEFVVLPNEKKAREVAEYRQRKQREAELVKTQKISLETMFERLQEQEVKELNIVLKTDVQGSLEAMSDALRKLSTKDIKVNIVRAGIGAITESDILLASASDALVVGFNVRPNAQAKALADQEKVDIRFYDVIYHAIDEIKQAMVGLLEPEYKEEVIGHAEVRQTFRVPKVGTIAGCYVLDGVVRRGANARLLRENVVVYTGKIASLRRFKEDVKEVASGFECGIGLENFNDIKVGDVIETYEMVEVKPTLGESVGEEKESK